ncbi:MAG: AAA family ATPase [Candidatus Omnitrophica bacterium]|nr:AAA family ATPase [Candidatus Omnitrophota bacterium]MDO9573188.1 AAA family ATPase [Candidatus Omnitrophota bacterium]
MGYVITMAGKGGTGKTTIAALIIRSIKNNKLGSVLAIDADPNSNLGELLGTKNKGSIGAILDDISASPDKIPVGTPKERFIQYQIQSAIQEGDGFDILNMGAPEGPGCYCYVNNCLRGIMAGLIKDYDYIVIDNEAGLEHLSRRITRYADCLVVVSDASNIGLKSAQRINELTKQVKFEVKRSTLLINRFNKNVDKEKIRETNLEYLGSLPFDLSLEELSLASQSIFNLKSDSPVLKIFNTLGEKIWSHN